MRAPPTRDEFIADLRARALELARAGDLVHAVTTVLREMNKRPDTKVAPTMAFAGTMKAMNDNSREVIAWIEAMK